LFILLCFGAAGMAFGAAGLAFGADFFA